MRIYFASFIYPSMSIVTTTLYTKIKLQNYETMKEAHTHTHLLGCWHWYQIQSQREESLIHGLPLHPELMTTAACVGKQFHHVLLTPTSNVQDIFLFCYRSVHFKFIFSFR